MMHPDKRQTIILALVVAVIAGGLLAWRFNLTPEIGRFFAANTERCNALLETANKDAYDDCVRALEGGGDPDCPAGEVWDFADDVCRPYEPDCEDIPGGWRDDNGECHLEVAVTDEEDCKQDSNYWWDVANQRCWLVSHPEQDCEEDGQHIYMNGECKLLSYPEQDCEEDSNYWWDAANQECKLLSQPEEPNTSGGTPTESGTTPSGKSVYRSTGPTGSNDGYTSTATGNIPPNSIFGWAFDPDESAKSIDVHVYFDGVPGCTSCTAIAANAGLERPDVNDVFSINGNHGFAVAVPGQYRDGKEHTANAYGIDSAGNGNLNSFIGTKTFTATMPKPMCTPAACANPPDGCSYQGGDSCNCGLLVCETELPPPPLCTPAACPNPPNGCSYQRSADGCQCGELICVILPPPGEHRAGDTNGDGKVNIFDYNLVVTNFGTTTSQGDATGDGKVDIFDYNAVVSNFGK